MKQFQDFFSAIHVRRKWENEQYLQIWGGNCNPKYLYIAKLSFTSEDNRTTFADVQTIQSLRECIAYVSILKKLLDDVFQPS